MPFLDHFSGVARQYAASRPSYPPALIERLGALVPAGAGPRRAWDAGCGSGQMSVLLAGVFDEVIATDASAAQIEAARPHPRVAYHTAPAEASGLPDAWADLSVAAQAVHWFDLPAYYREVRRVTRPGGAVALVVYSRPALERDLDPALQRLYRAVDPHWPAERAPVDDRYATLPFPFEELPFPGLEMTLDWDLAQLLDYAGTWSSTQGFVRARGADALADVVRPLRDAWGEPARRRTVRWPVGVRAGRVDVSAGRAPPR